MFTHANETYVSAMEKLISEVLRSDLVKEGKSDNRLFDTQQRILSSQNNQLIKVVNLMENNLEIKLSEVASKCGLSPRSLTRLTNEETGLSPNELHTFYRIKKASELIYLGELSLTGVAFECGYNSLSQFIENFKRWTGSKPSQHVSAV
jgi:AraC-like DNA-binding protein